MTLHIYFLRGSIHVANDDYRLFCNTGDSFIVEAWKENMAVVFDFFFICGIGYNSSSLSVEMEVLLFFHTNDIEPFHAICSLWKNAVEGVGGMSADTIFLLHFARWSHGMVA